jgi:glycosyltransferase involved in cell wall biosynthesis
VIIGKGPDMNKLKNLSNENIIFTGCLSDKDLLNYARGADIAVLPSRAESWGLVIGEAMACKLPVISSNVGMAKELLGNNRGIVLQKETIKELTDKIDYLLNNREICKEMGERSREYIVKNYGWEKVVKKIVQVYKEVIENYKN